jgi:hypothetical protein
MGLDGFAKVYLTPALSSSSASLGSAPGTKKLVKGTVAAASPPGLGLLRRPWMRSPLTTTSTT